MNPVLVQTAAPLAWLVLSLCVGIVLYRKGEAFFEDSRLSPGRKRTLRLTGSALIALGTFGLLRRATPALASEPLAAAYELLQEIEQRSGTCSAVLGGSAIAAAAGEGIELIGRCQTLAIALPLLWAGASVGAGLVLYRFGSAFLDDQTRERGRVRRYRLGGAVFIAAAFFLMLKEATPLPSLRDEARVDRLYGLALTISRNGQMCDAQERAGASQRWGVQAERLRWLIEQMWPRREEPQS